MSLGVQGIKSVLHKPEFGLLVIRIALAIILIQAGWAKFSSGEDTLHSIGSSVKFVGLDIGQDNAVTLLFGIAAAGSELIGGILLVVGWLFRIASSLLLATLVVATVMMYQVGKGDIAEFGYPMVLALVLLGLIFTGPGKLSLQKE